MTFNDLKDGERFTHNANSSFYGRKEGNRARIFSKRGRPMSRPGIWLLSANTLVWRYNGPQAPDDISKGEK